MLIEFTFYFFHIEAGLKNHFKFQLAIWASSSHVLLAQGNYLLVIANDFVRVSCPARKPTHPRRPLGLFLSPAKSQKVYVLGKMITQKKNLTILHMMLTQRKKKRFSKTES